MHEEYNSILTTTAEANKIGWFDRYWYISKTQISAWYIQLVVYPYFNL